METVIEYTDKDKVWISTDEQSLKNSLLKIADTNSDIKVLRYPQDNDGCLYATVPHSWIKVKPPKTLSDESQKKLAEHIKKARDKKINAVEKV